MVCSFHHEEAVRAGRAGFRIAGVDEAGRGPLAGPLVVAAYVFPGGAAPSALNDSKKLSARVRERLFDELVGWPGSACSVVTIEPPEIDRLNILEATRWGMCEAVRRLGGIDHCLVDGLAVPGFPVPQTALVGGDGLSCSIAAASILAKVTRDRIMVDHDMTYPLYGFARHKGYPTREHLDKLASYGPTPIHRFSFAPVAQSTFRFGAP